MNEDFPPLEAYITDDGAYVVLRDTWGEVGEGKVLSFLGPKGEEIKSYELSDILNQEEILDARLTVSSTWWSENGWFGFTPDGKRFAFITQRRTVESFDLATGRMLDVSPEEKAALFEQAKRDLAHLASSSDADDRSYWASMMGVLDAKDMAPQLRKLLGDTTVTSQTGRGLAPPEDCRGVRLAAASALASLIGPRAAADIEPLLAEENVNMREDLLSAIESIDCDDGEPIASPYASDMLAVWKRLASSPIEDVRVSAQKQLLKRDNGEYLLAHRELLESTDERLRFEAAFDLSQHGTMAEAPLLEKMLHDTYEPTQSWALRGLVRIWPPNIDDILKQALSSNNLRSTAIAASARRGNRKAIAMLVADLERIKDPSADLNGWGLNEICTLVAELNLKQAEPALRAVLYSSDEEIRRQAAGALAALGDVDALLMLRRFAVEGEPLDRADSIEMLGTIRDTVSVPFLKKACNDHEPFVSRAAKEALAKIESTAPAAR